MRRLLFAVSLIAGICVKSAYAADWRIAGLTETAIKENVYAFYDADTVSRPTKSTARVWVSLVPEATIEDYWKKEENETLVAAGRKLSTGYRPQFFKI